MWSKPRKTKPLIDPESVQDGLILGVTAVHNPQGQEVVTPAVIYPGMSTLSQHGNIAVCGPPGAGKTATILSNCLSWRHSMVLIDLKGGVYTSTAEKRREFGQVYMIDMRDGYGHRYNPLQYVPRDMRRDLAAELVGITNDDPFWSTVASDMWLACWAAADHAGRPHMPYAVELMRLSTVDAFRYLFYHHGDDPQTMQHVRDFWGRQPSEDEIAKLQNGDPSRLLESMWKTVITTRTIFDDPTMLRVFSGHDIDVPGMFYNGGISTIYIKADEKKPKSFAAFARLTMRTIGDCLIDEGDREGQKRRPVAFIFDEFGVVRLNSAIDWLNTMRSRDVVLALFGQRLSHFQKTGENLDIDDQNSIHHWMLFKPTNPAGNVGQMITEISGLTTAPYISGRSTTTSADGTVSTTESIGYRERHVMEVEDIKRMAPNQAYVSIHAQTTETYVVTAAMPWVLGWEMPPAAPPPSPLPPYQSCLLPMPDGAADVVGNGDSDNPAQSIEDMLSAMCADADALDGL